MDVFALTMRLKEEGAAQVEAAMDKMRRSMDQAGTEATQLDGAFAKLKTAMAGLVAGASVGVVINKIVQETSAAQFAQAQLEAALRSTGGAAGQSAEALTEHASALQKVTVFGDDAIIAAQSLLLTFTKIQGDTFPKATEAVLNVAQAMGTDLRSAAIQVGKALNDPVAGVSALARSGIQFTQAQKDTIASLVETNRTVEAQTLILKELETQFGGSAAAARNTLGGALKGLQNDFGDLFEVSNTGSAGIVSAINKIAGALQPLAGALNTALQNFQAFFVEVRRAAENLWLGIQRIFVQMAGLFLKILTPLTFLPGKAGENAAYGLGLMQQALKDVDASLAAEQKVVADVADELLRLIYVGERAKAITARATTGEGGAGGPRRETPAEVARRIAGMAPAGGAAFKEGFKVAAVDSEVLAREKVAKARAFLSETQALMLKDWQDFAGTMAAQMAETLLNGIAGAFEGLVARGGSIKSFFSSITQMLLSGLGDMLVKFGTYAVMTSKLMAKLYASIPTNPIAGIGIGLAMIALGSALKGAASRIFTPGGGGGGGAPAAIVGGMSGGGGVLTLPGLTYAPTAAGSAATIQQVQPMNVTIIGPNDPSAQRQMQELMRNAKRRGEA